MKTPHCTWHLPSCRRPDLYFVDGIPFCSYCGESPDSDNTEPEPTSGIPPLPLTPPSDTLNISWPSSIEYQPDIAPSSVCPSTAPHNFQDVESPPSSALPSLTIYTPLETPLAFRLLLLTRGTPSSRIHGTLSVRPLSPNIDFTALSYTWADDTGDNTRRKLIFLGDDWKPFKVTANCHAALRRMRHQDKDILVWVDAICIDQGNHVERNHQVGMMVQVYQYATEVFVYLGEGNRRVEGALESLALIRRQPGVDYCGSVTAIQALFQLRYFRRVWVLQEIANSQSAVVHYGDKVVGWADFDAVRDHMEAPKWIGKVYKGKGWTASDLPELLHQTASCEASDDRDRVFALFGLIKDAAAYGLVADYSLSSYEVSVGAAAFALLKCDLGLLEIARGVNDKNMNLPTWVPDWKRWDARRPPKGTGWDAYISSRGHLHAKSLTVVEIDPFGLYCTRNEWLWIVLMPEIRHHLAALQAGYQGRKEARGRIVLLQGQDKPFHVESVDANQRAWRIIAVCRGALSQLLSRGATTPSTKKSPSCASENTGGAEISLCDDLGGLTCHDGNWEEMVIC